MSDNKRNKNLHSTPFVCKANLSRPMFVALLQTHLQIFADILDYKFHELRDNF